MRFAVSSAAVSGFDGATAPTFSSQSARPILLCFPHAGGGTRVFHTWINAFADVAEVIPVRLPGREDLFLSSPFTDLSEIVAWVIAHHSCVLNRPLIVFGHSMGALLAYTLARQLSAVNKPKLLIVAGYRPPHLPRQKPQLHHLPSAQFWQALRVYGGIDDAILAAPELRELIEPVLRADFQVIETYQHCPENAALSCPIVALTGRQDAVASPVEMAQWRALTTAEFTQYLFDGNHFFLTAARATVVAAVAAVTTAAAPISC